MKVYYMKQRVIKNVTMTLEEIEQLTGFSSPGEYKANPAQLEITLESVEIPDDLVEEFKEAFKEAINDKRVLREKEVMDFLEIWTFDK